MIRLLLPMFFSPALAFFTVIIFWHFGPSHTAWIAGCAILFSHLVDFVISTIRVGGAGEKELRLWFVNLSDRLKEYIFYMIAAFWVAKAGEAPLIPFLAFLVIAYRDYDNHLLARWHELPYTILLSFNGTKKKSVLLWAMTQPTLRYLALSAGIAFGVLKETLIGIVVTYLLFNIVVDIVFWKKGVPKSVMGE